MNNTIEQSGFYQLQKPKQVNNSPKQTLPEIWEIHYKKGRECCITKIKYSFHCGVENVQVGKDFIFCLDKTVMPWSRKIQAPEKNKKTKNTTTKTNSEELKQYLNKTLLHIKSSIKKLIP